MYAGHAFGVTVYAPEEALLDDAFALVEMRPAGEVRGTE